MLAGLMNGTLARLGELIHEGKTGPLMVWRVENVKGLGPYQGTPEKERIFGDDPTSPDLPTNDRALMRFVMSGDKFGGKYTSITKHSAQLRVKDALNPVPDTDFEHREWAALPDRTRTQYKFAFPTKRAATDWFGTKRLREFEVKGFKLVQVPARRVVLSKSGRQVMYVPWDTTYRAPPKDYYQKWREEAEESRRRSLAYFRKQQRLKEARRRK